MAAASENRVRLLDPHTVNQIAAGEVVERPAAAVKELVENAIDAGARRIEIELQAAGRDLIRVTDDGIGMSDSDAQTALGRHATSKIASADDIHGVRTLGFRGEALPSIASVSRMTLRTSTADGVRHVLRIEGGEIAPIDHEAGPHGTEVTVEDLFFNTPARLKFLKSDTTEVGQCVDLVMRYAIAYPQIAFRVTHNGQEALATNGAGDDRDAIAAVWGRDMARALVPVDAEIGGMHLTGYVSPPHITKPTRAFQYVFVNGRPVRTRSITAALDQAFRDLTPDRRFPLVALNISIEPQRVDINVSPTKSEVKFQQEGLAFEAIRTSLKSALAQHGMMPSAAQIAAVRAAEGAAPSNKDWTPSWLPTAPGALAAFGGFGPQFGASPGTSTGLYPQVPGGSGEGVRESAAALPIGFAPSATIDPLTPAEERTFAPFSAQTDGNLPFAALLDGLRIIGQAMNAFIIAETSHGIVLIDQHVAHERVIYEDLCGIRGATPIERQQLLVPVTVHLDRRSMLMLNERRDEIERLGFDIEPFGGDSWVIRTAPAALRGRDPARILRDLVEELVESATTRRMIPTRETIWITTSCKMAVKAGDPLSHAEMERLIHQLAATENPYMCPHGRPITVTLTTDDLLKIFKRK